MFNKRNILVLFILSFSCITCYDEELKIRIEGLVLDVDEDSPIVGAKVTLYHNYGRSQVNFLVSGTTNNDGYYSLNYTS